MPRSKGRNARTTLLGVSRGLVGTIVVAAIAIALVWPLWYLATTHTDLYTVLVLAAVAAWAVYAVARRRRRGAVRTRGGAAAPELVASPAGDGGAAASDTGDTGDTERGLRDS